MESLTIRKARIDDLPILRVFEQGVIAAERPFDESIQPDPTHYYDLPAMLESSHIELLVAETGGKVVGSGYARIEASRHYLKHQQHAYLGFMYVEPAYRGRSINKAILKALEKWAAEQGMTELRLDVYELNEPAIKAYEKAGFSKLMVQMRKPVAEIIS